MPPNADIVWLMAKDKVWHAFSKCASLAYCGKAHRADCRESTKSKDTHQCLNCLRAIDAKYNPKGVFLLQKALEKHAQTNAICNAGLRMLLDMNADSDFVAGSVIDVLVERVQSLEALLNSTLNGVGIPVSFAGIPGVLTERKDGYIP